VALPLIARDELEILATAVERPLVSEMDSLVRPCVDDGALKVEREVLAVLLHGSAGVAESRAWRLLETPGVFRRPLEYVVVDSGIRALGEVESVRHPLMITCRNTLPTFSPCGETP